MINIQQPDIEAMIQQRLQDGGFGSVEEVLRQALKDAPMPRKTVDVAGRTGADLVAIMQAIPYRDVDFEAARAPMDLREIEF